MSVPSSIIAVLAHFEPLFTAPTWKKVLILLLGTLLARGRRTVTAALRQMGQQMNAQFSGFHQVLNRARWSPLEVSRRLLQVLVDTFVRAGGTVEMVMDETLERRWGRKISKRGHWRDSLRSSKERDVEYQWLTVGDDGIGREPALDETALGLAVLECPGHHAKGERSAGQAAQDARSHRAATGAAGASLATWHPDQGDWRWGLQRD